MLFPLQFYDFFFQKYVSRRSYLNILFSEALRKSLLYLILKKTHPYKAALPLSFMSDTHVHNDKLQRSAD